MLLTPQPASGRPTKSNSSKRPRSDSRAPSLPPPLRGPAAPALVMLRASGPRRRVWVGGAAATISAPLDIRIDMGFRLAARMGDSPFLGVPHGLSIAPDGPRLIVVAARLPGLAALGQLGIAEVDLERALRGIEADHVA